jgi:triacylglycerol lipase
VGAEHREDDLIPKVYKACEAVGLDTGAFRQLTRTYMLEEFNPETPNVQGVK